MKIQECKRINNSFYDAYRLANKINKDKSYISTIKLKTNQRSPENMEEILEGRKIRTGGCMIDVMDGSISKQYIDFTIFCMGRNLIVKRIYNTNCTNIGLFGQGWLFDYETYSRYTPDGFEVFFVDGGMESFTKQEGKWINKNNRSLISVAAENVDKDEIIVLKEKLYYIYSLDGRLKSIRDKNKNFFELRYINGTNLIHKIETSCGRTLDFKYKNNKISEISDTIGRTVKYFYENDLLVTVEQANGGKYKFSYDKTHGKIVQIVDPNGNIEFKTEYERYGKPIRLYMTNEVEWTLSYDERNKEMKFTATNNLKQVIYKHDRSKLVKQISFQDGSIIKLEYDVYKNLISKTDKKGNITECKYNNFNQLILKTEKEKTENYFYNDLGLIAKIIASNGEETMLEYDKRENLIERKNKTYKGSISVRQYEYDSKGRIILTLDPNKNPTKYLYNNEKSVFPEITVYANHHTLECGYDQVGRLIKKIEFGHITEFKYNNLDLLIQTVFPNGSMDFKRYDLAGNLKELVLPKEMQASQRENRASKKYNYNYNEKNFLIKITTPKGCIYNIQRDFEGNEIHQYHSDINQKKENTYQIINHYDYIGNVLEKWLPQTENENGDVLYQKIKYLYDKNSNLIEEKTASGYVTSEEEPASYAIKKYSYDSRNNISNIHTGTGSDTHYIYKGMNLLSKETTRINENKEYKIVYEYNEMGLLSKKIDLLDLDDADLDNIHMDIKDISAIKIETSFGYDENGSLIGVTLPNGKYLSIQYDEDGEIIYTKETEFLKMETENQKKIELENEEGKIEFTYDKFDRVVKRSYPDGRYELIDYDFNNNIASFTDVHGQTTRYIYNSINKIKTIIHSQGETTDYTYGLDGESFNKKTNEVSM